MTRKASGRTLRDGHADILWQNTNGSTAIWDTLGTAIDGGGIIGLNPGSNWHIGGVGNFFGNGNTDIAWQNDDGSVAIWDMNGDTIAAGGVVSLNPGPVWHLTGTGNFFGQGNNSLEVQNDDGSIAVWGMKGTTIAEGGVIPVNPGTSWHAFGTADGMHFINGESGNQALTATAQPDEFVLSSFASGSHTITGFDVAHDIVELSRTLFSDFADVQAHATALGGGTLIDLDPPGSHSGAIPPVSTLLLQGVSSDSLHANNFALV